MGGFLWMIVGNAAALGAALSILRVVRTGDAWSDVVLFALIRLALISGAILVAGLLGGLTPVGLGVPAAVILGGLMVTRQYRYWRPGPLPTLGLPLMAITLAVLVRLCLQVWFQSPYLGDPLAYHLPKIAEWIRAGRFIREMGVHTHVTFPAGFELLETWWVVFLRHDLLIEAAGVEFVLLGFAAVMALGKQLELPDRWAWLSSLLFCLTPTFHVSATSCLNDSPAASLILATMALGARRAHPCLLVMVAGLGLGLKPTYGFALPGMTLLWWLSRNESTPARPRLAAAVPLAALGLVVGVFWYARNLLWFGNPFYPLGKAGFVDPTPVQFGPGLASLASNLSNLIEYRITDSAVPYSANADHSAGWGAVAFACGGIALFETATSEPRVRRLAAAFGLALAVTLAMVQNDPWNLKYVSWVPALLCLATAKLHERLPGVGVVAAATLLFSFLGTFFSYDLRPDHVRTLALQPWAERSAARLPYGEVTMEIKDDSVAYFGGPMGATYLLYKPDFSRRVVYLRSRTEDELANDARNESVSLIFAPRPTREQKDILDRGVAQGTLTTLTGCFYRLKKVSE